MSRAAPPAADAIRRPIVRRAILELLSDIGGANNDQIIAEWLARMGHVVSGRDVRADLHFLADLNLVRIETLQDFVIADVSSDGRDVAEGRLRIDGVSRHRVYR